MAIDSIHPNSPGLDRTLAFRDTRLPGNQQAGVEYTPELADIEKVIRMTGAAASVVTIPADATTDFPIGTLLSVARDGAGSVSIAAAAGVTINREPATQPSVAAQYGLVNLRKTAANTWALFGAVAAA
jgi:hypothetical protein